jgi:hypothetical protein
MEDPERTYQSIRSDALKGKSRFSTAKSEKRSGELQLRLGLADEVPAAGSQNPHLPGQRQDVISLLSEKDVVYPTAGDLAIKRNLLCGMAYSRLN